MQCDTQSPHALGFALQKRKFGTQGGRELHCVLLGPLGQTGLDHWGD